MTSNYINEISKEYGNYILDYRGIPSIDGLKQVQRTALWVMRNQSTFTKVSEVVGDMMRSRLYVHGDASAGDAVSRLAGPFLNNVPLVEGKGAFGTRISPLESIGAPRYVSVKRSTAAEKIVLTDLDIIPHVLNYDESTSMPKFFLPLIPLLLLNGINGIATGWSTNILPHSLSDLIDCTLDIIDGKSCAKLMPIWDRYNGEVKEIEKNKYSITGKFKRLDSSRVLVTELPHTISRNKYVEILEEIIEPKKPKEKYISPIKDYVDESASGLKFEIRFARGMLSSYTDDDIIKILKLRDTEVERIVLIGWNGGPVLYESAEAFAEDYVKFRLGWYKTRYENLHAEEQKTLEYLGSLLACYDASLADSIRTYSSKKELIGVIKNIVEKADYNPHEHNLIKIADLPSYKWTNEGYLECLEKIDASMKKIDEYANILKDPEIRRQIYKSEVKELRKLVK